MNNLVQRILTGLIAGSAVIGAIVYDGYGLMIICALVSILGLHEFLKLNNAQTNNLFTAIVLGSAVWVGYLVIYLTGYSPEKEGMIWKAMPLILPILSLVVLFQAKEKHPVPTIGIMAMGFLYCYLPFILLFNLGFPNEVYDFRIPLGILLLTWVLDSGAYFVGRAIGKRPLFPRISPKKTWEGSLGGAVLCVALGVGMEYYPFASENLSFNWIIVAVIISIFSQFGDLVESMYKRSMSIKDSGSILPGHGGILDRFDGIYISVPFIYFYLTLVSL